MKAKDLRIGNLIYYRDKDHVLLEINNLGHFFNTVNKIRPPITKPLLCFNQ